LAQGCRPWFVVAAETVVVYVTTPCRRRWHTPPVVGPPSANLGIPKVRLPVWAWHSALVIERPGGQMYAANLLGMYGTGSWRQVTRHTEGVPTVGVAVGADVGGRVGDGVGLGVERHP